MRLRMPGDCPGPGRTDELSRERAAFIISTPGRKGEFRELKQQTDEAIHHLESEMYVVTFTRIHSQSLLCKYLDIILDSDMPWPRSRGMKKLDTA